MLGTTLCFDELGSLMLLLVGERAPAQHEWKQYVDALKELTTRHDKVRLVVVAGSGAPDALQRKQFTDALPSKKLRTAVISDSVVARGVVTAFRWAGMDLDAFKHEAIANAYRFLAVSPEELAWLQMTLATMRTLLNAPRVASR